MPDPMDLLFAHSQNEHLNLLSKVPPTLSMIEGVGVLSFEAISLSTFEAGKRIPAKYRWEGKNLRFSISEHSLSYVKRTWPNVIILKPMAPKREAPVAKVVDYALPWRPRMAPFQHQAEAFRLLAPLDEFACLMDMGTGKTKVAIDIAAFHFARREIDRVLVVAPNGVHEQWIDKALPEHWPLELGIRLDAITTGAKKPEWWGDWTRDPRDCKWLAVNIENIKVKTVHVGRRKTYELDGLSEQIAEFLEGGPALIIWDESHKGKNPQALRTLAMWKFARITKYRGILTGTPMARGLEDYYAQFRFLNQNIIGVWSMSGFKQQFCVMGGFDNTEIQGYRNTDEFHKRIGAVSYRVEKSDVLDLPPKMYVERTVTMTAEQRRVYNELKIELMTVLSDGTNIQAGEVVQRMLRLQQVTQGFLPRDDDTFEEFPDNRLDSLMDMLEQSSGRVIIWCRFSRDIDRILAKLGDEAVRYDGKNKDDRPQVKRDWLAPDSRKRFFVGNAAAGGTGLDWINGAQTVIYYSNSFNSLDRWQSEDRTHRIGTTGTVTYYDMICKGTLDRVILANLKRKRDISEMSLTELKQVVAEA